MTFLVNTRFAFRRINNRNAVRSTPGGLAYARSGLTLNRHMSTMHDNDPHTLETEKMRNLRNQQHKTSTPHTNAPGWNETLASESEADIKADRSDPFTTTELQEQTIEYVASRYTPDDRKSTTTAQYPRDSVDGPLGHAPGQEDGQEVYKTVVKKVEKKTTMVEDDSTKGYA